jgi:hypothetical protein
VRSTTFGFFGFLGAGVESERSRFTTIFSASAFVRELRQRRTSASSSSRVISSTERLFVSSSSSPASGSGERDGNGVRGISPSPFKAPVKLLLMSLCVPAQ